jgi:tRNA pseudouridine55 synthase
MQGFLNINKPSGISSRTAVDRVVRVVPRGLKVGHAGTLDPLASGVLVVAVGSATRLIDRVQQMTKRYRATFRLGQSSPTEDTEGEITLLDDAPQPSDEQLAAAGKAFVGEILQRPPIFSALKVGGRRAYALARKGAEVELEPRPITVHRLDVVEYRYPEVVLDIECSSGTYVRSLGRDLAEHLGTAAVMSALVRTSIGSFRIAESCELGNVSEIRVLKNLQPVAVALTDLPRLTLTSAAAIEIGHGRRITWEDAPAMDEIAAFDEHGSLIAILARSGENQLKPLRVFTDSAGPRER